MLAQVKKEPFDDTDWVFETKYDGYRALALCDGKGNTQLYSRNLLSFNTAFAPIVESLKKMTHPCLIDGEVVVEDNRGRSDFQLLQNYQRTKQGGLKYYTFDLLTLDGNDITGLSLLKRKELLKLLLTKAPLKNVFYSDHIAAKGIKFYAKAVKKGQEGIMAKNAESLYYPDRRSADWLKIKITNEQEAVIIGITEPKGQRQYFGSLLLGVYDKGVLQYVGHCGTGFDEKALKELYAKFKKIFTDKSPFNYRVPVNGKVQWMKPKLVCQVKFTEWTEDGSMRHPVYLGLRVDKKATQVVKEIPKK